MTRKPHLFSILILAGAALGLFFAGFSTSDFARHLDRQRHSVSCSFTPGLSKAETGKSDCRTTMLSEYSSVMRSKVWGGVPIALPAMSVFAFLLLFAVELCLTRRQEDVRATGFLALATALPAFTSMVMAFISFSKLDAACKLCIGIYFSSAVVVTGGILLWRRAVRLAHDGAFYAALPASARPAHAAQGPYDQTVDPAWTGATAPTEPAGIDVQQIPPRPAGTVAGGGGRAPLPVPWGYLGAAFAVGIALVIVPVVTYASMAPDHSSFIGTCGDLMEEQDPYGVMVPLDHHGGAGAIEVFDPLCPACRGFEKRLETSEFDTQLHRVALLFPLDSECNWMVTERTHPGACAISEAVLCAGDRAPEVVHWAFEQQEAIKAASSASGDAARDMARSRFPELASCVGSAAAKAKLNKSLRWAVRNQLAVYTPQLYLDGVKLCDEDTDLGLEYTLGRMIERSHAGTLRTHPPGAAPPAAVVPPMPEPEPAAPAHTKQHPATTPPAEQPPAATPPAEQPAEQPPAEQPPAATPPAATPPAATPPAATPPAATPPAATPPAATPPAATPPADPPAAGGGQ